MNAINGYAPANAGSVPAAARAPARELLRRHPAAPGQLLGLDLQPRRPGRQRRAAGDRRAGGGLRPGRGGAERPGVARRCCPGTTRAHGDEPFIDQLVLAFTCGPGGPVGRRLADDGRDERCRRAAVELGRDRRAALPDQDRQPADRDRHRGRRAPARCAGGRARAHADGRRDRVHVPQRRHHQPGAGRARRRARRDGAAGAARRATASRATPICAPACGCGRGRRCSAAAAAAAGTAIRSSASRPGRQGRDASGSSATNVPSRATESSSTTTVGSIHLRRNGSARRCDRARRRRDGRPARGGPVHQRTDIREERTSVSARR